MSQQQKTLKPEVKESVVCIPNPETGKMDCHPLDAKITIGIFCDERNIVLGANEIDYEVVITPEVADIHQGYEQQILAGAFGAVCEKLLELIQGGQNG